MGIRRSLAFSFLEKYASTAINLASTLVLARLLSPAEIGVFSVGAAVVGIMHSLRDFGVTNYLIQEREINQVKLRTAFTVTLGLSWAFAGLLLAGSGWAAEFYREEGVRQIVWVLAANFLMIPFGSPILALMRRELQFGQLAAIQLASTAVNATTGILLAALDHGFMSLAWASLAGVATTSGLAFTCRPHAFLLKPGITEWRSVLAFGSYASANALVGDLRLMAPDLILGRLLSFEAVGLYSRAIGLLAIFNRLIINALQPVLLPALAEKVRRGEDLRETYLRAMEYVTVLHWPFLAFLAFMADPIIRILLGDQWLEAVPIVRILCVAMAINFPAFMTGPVLISLGRIRDMLIINLILLPVSIALMVAGSLHSLSAVASSIIVVNTLSFGLIIWIVAMPIGITPMKIIWSTRRSILVTILSSAFPSTDYLFYGTNGDDYLYHAVIVFVGSCTAWVLGLFLFSHPMRRELWHWTMLVRDHLKG